MNEYQPPEHGPRGHLWIVGAAAPRNERLPVAGHFCRLVLCESPNEAIDLFWRANPDLPAGVEPWVRPFRCVNLTVGSGLTRAMPPGIYLGISNAEGPNAKPMDIDYEQASGELCLRVVLKRLGGP